eukprot:383363-Pleurochrysis_carterae.AAC.3
MRAPFLCMCWNRAKAVRGCVRAAAVATAGQKKSQRERPGGMGAFARRTFGSPSWRTAASCGRSRVV